MKIAVVGAQGTGKSTLVAALQLALPADALQHAFTVIADWAPEQRHTYDLALLMGLDLPASSSPHRRMAATQRDGQLRQLMDQHAIAYAVVYGSGQTRTDNALQAIEYRRNNIGIKRSPASTSASWQWCCDTCSDAACEHRLFTALVNKPAASVRP